MVSPLRQVLIAFLVAAAATAHAAPVYEEEPIKYSDSTPHDPVAMLKDQLDQGKLKLECSPAHGYLESLLKHLNISPSSQTLVFSKTSFQRNRISPKNPRALYFNDDVYVGYVPGGDLLEIASTDPKLGTVFYTLHQRSSDQPLKILRQTDNCLQCHGESMTNDTPGLLIRSVFPDERGNPILSAGTFLSTHESPIKERWGGWYVTGKTAEPHLGNQRFTERENQAPEPLGEDAKPDLSEYPKPTSDVVALMVLEHQVEAHNRITRANYDALRALRDEKIVADAMGEKFKEGEHSESTLRRVAAGCEPLIQYLLFSGETLLKGSVQCDPSFKADFTSKGPRDAKGRSLRDFDLKTRLFRHPCSYLIYSPALDALPEIAQGYIQKKLYDILTGKDAGDAFKHLTPADRTAILEILRDTKPTFRAAWEKLASSNK
ncbi:MAG TPA: hypothetical protein VF669_00120 [Tepidisphaeraceae bacterium]